MRKIPNNLENPLDNHLIDLCEYVSPTFYNYGFTPNMITTLSNISTILVILLLLNANYVWASFFVLVAYFFDCLDGHLARKYNLTTEFGDYYDHISDAVKIIAILCTLYYIDSSKLVIVMPFLLIVTLLMMMHIGCQEQYYNSMESQSLHFMKNLCPIDLKNNKEHIENKMQFTKYFGAGTGTIAVMLSILYYKI